MSSPEEAARGVMQFIVGRGYKVGDFIENARLTAISVEAGFDKDDIRNALLFAGDSGWITSGPPGHTKLTDAGFKAGGALMSNDPKDRNARRRDPQ